MRIQLCYDKANKANLSPADSAVSFSYKLVKMLCVCVCVWMLTRVEQIVTAICREL